MNAYYPRRAPTRLGPRPRLDLPPRAASLNRAALNADLETLKSRLVKEHLLETGNASLAPELRRAANEAAALVWLTPYPLLLLPLLLTEKIEAIQHYHHRQAQIRRRSRALAAEG